MGVVDVNASRMAIATRSSSDYIVALKPDEAGISVNSGGDITTQYCGIHATSIFKGQKNDFRNAEAITESVGAYSVEGESAVESRFAARAVG